MKTTREIRENYRLKNGENERWEDIETRQKEWCGKEREREREIERGGGGGGGTCQT